MNESPKIERRKSGAGAVRPMDGVGSDYLAHSPVAAHFR